MIGQHNLKDTIDKITDNFPRFSLLVGPVGSGRKIITQYVCNNLHCQYYLLSDVKIESIRKVIESAYKVWSPTLYVIPDADKMSVSAKNALLKVTEEPPNNAYFIMTLTSEDNTLDTIKSRGVVLHMDNYTPEELKNFYSTVSKNNSEDEISIVQNICETPGDVLKLNEMGITDFYNYMELVVNNITKVSLPNALKIASKIKFKDDGDGYDLSLFLKAFNRISANRILEDYRYRDNIYITSRCINDLRINGINKQMLFDTWLLDIRESWV